MEDKSFQLRKREELLKKLSEGISDPTHKRLIHAYQGDRPVESMEAELKKILTEVLQDED